MLGPALRFVGLHRDLMPAFAEGVTDDPSKTSLPPGRGAAETEGALISGIRCPVVRRAGSQTEVNPLKTKPCGKAARRLVQIPQKKRPLG